MARIFFSEEDLKGILESFNISQRERNFLRNVLSRIDTSYLRHSLRDFCGAHLIKEDKLFFYFRKLLQGDINLEYLCDRVKVGITHERLGVLPRSYIAQFSKWLDSVVNSLKEKLSSEELVHVLSLLFKVVLLDIALCVEAYDARHVERYKKIFDSMKDAVIVMNMKSGITHMVNNKMSELLEFSTDELLKKKLSDILSVDIDVILEGRQRDIFLKAKDGAIPVIANAWVYELAGERYAVCTFKDIRDEIRREKEVSLLQKLYHTLSAINILITTAENKDSLLKGTLHILKEKGDFGYVAIFKKGMDLPLIEKGKRAENVPSLCIPFGMERDEYVLEVSLTEDLEFTDKEKGLLEEIAHDLSFGLSRIEKHQRLTHVAYYDETTRLPNRIYFFNQLQDMVNRARAKTFKVAVISIIIDGFHELEHFLDHYWKNELERAISYRIRSRLREKDLLARIEKDRFCIAIESNNPRPVVEDMIARIRASFTEPLYFNNDEIIITLSFGIAKFPYDAEDADELLSKSMLCAERAQELGGNTDLFYSEELAKRLEDRISIRTSLRGALDRKEFVLYYQPKIELCTGKLMGAEALIRWIKDGKVILPSKFVPILEESELIHKVGKWVIGEACAQVEKWKEEGMEIDVSVNVSPVQLQSISSMEEIISAISSCDTDNLEVEITESAVMEDVSRSISFIEMLMNMGIKTYIDDFGTGYSSLAQLKKLPVYALKIDREFIKDIPQHQHDVEIVRTVVGLAKVFGMKTVAEGPETEEQVKILRELGCDYAQGYYFSKPLPAEKFGEYVKNFSPAKKG